MLHYRAAQIAIFAALLCISTANQLSAAPGDPIAVRHWKNGGVSVETHWGFVIAIDAAKDTPGLQAAQSSVTTGEGVNHVLSRLPNEPKPVWLPAAKMKRVDSNAVAVRSEVHAGLSLITVEVDGVRIAKATWQGSDAKAAQDASAVKPVDVLLLTSTNAKQLLNAKFASAVKSLKPHTIVLDRRVAEANKPPVKSFAINLNIGGDVKNVSHNTLAVAAVKTRTSKIRLVTLGTSPWKMPVDLAREFAAMEKASSDSQKVFAKLSAKQLNFKPSNGTHTPRWNTEHMMGRQLLFFSQIYHQQQPAIPALDLNPKQMPKDYVFAHPTWNGVEEARQMQRVSDFTRRFAYLLDGVKLNQRAPGSRWPSLLALLRQMQRHYGEHTANTVKKFSLPDFPQE